MKLKTKSTIVKEYAQDERIKKINIYRAHGITSVYEHSCNVAAMCCWFARKMKSINQTDIVIGALLHDYYLYDWHNGVVRKIHHKHGYKACENATKIFELDEKTKNIIESHMWPLNFKVRPHSKEAVIVNISDKICAMLELSEGVYNKIKPQKKEKIRKHKS